MIAPKHTVSVIKSYLQCKGGQEVLEVMVWSSQIPDLNIIKSVWNYMKRQKDLSQPTSTEDLWLFSKIVGTTLKEPCQVPSKTVCKCI